MHARQKMGRVFNKGANQIITTKTITELNTDANFNKFLKNNNLNFSLKIKIYIYDFSN